MNSRRIALESDVERYEIGKGMEDGFEPLHVVVTKGWIVIDNLVRIEQEDGTILCPYIKNRRGRTFIGVGDYVIIDEDGTKHVCGGDKIFVRYKKVEE